MATTAYDVTPQIAKAAKTLGSVAEQIAAVLQDGDTDECSRRVLARLYHGLSVWAASWSDWADHEAVETVGEPRYVSAFGSSPDDIGWLKISVRTYGALERAGIRSVLELKAARREGRRIPQIGEKGWREIDAAIAALEEFARARWVICTRPRSDLR